MYSGLRKDHPRGIQKSLHGCFLVDKSLSPQWAPPLPHLYLQVATLGHSATVPLFSCFPPCVLLHFPQNACSLILNSLPTEPPFCPPSLNLNVTVSEIFPDFMLEHLLSCLHHHLSKMAETVAILLPAALLPLPQRRSLKRRELSFPPCLLSVGHTVST